MYCDDDLSIKLVLKLKFVEKGGKQTSVVLLMNPWKQRLMYGYEGIGQDRWLKRLLTSCSTFIHYNHLHTNFLLY